MKDIAALLYRHTGIVYDTKRLEHSVDLKKFLHEHSIALDSLKSFLQDPLMAQKFIDAMTISHSYFFREYEAIDFVTKRYKKEQAILSLPCGSGEEPYSILIALMEQGKEEFSITGADINRTSLEQAKAAIYPPRKLHNLPLHIKKRYFIYKDGLYHLKNSYKKVEFVHKNILFLSPWKEFDYIFCRNLFIYFDEQKRKEALENLLTLLHPKGYLLFGQSDSIPSHPRLKRIGSAIYQKI